VLISWGILNTLQATQESCLVFLPQDLHWSKKY